MKTVNIGTFIKYALLVAFAFEVAAFTYKTLKTATREITPRLYASVAR